MNCSAAIFDLDGTLLNTLDDLSFAGNKVLEELGLPTHSASAYRYFVGDGLRTLIRRITPADFDDSEIDRCCRLFGSYYSQCWDRNSHPYNGIEKMLEELHSRGIRCSVLSNKPHQFTRIYIERYFSSHSFACVFGQREGVNKKPDPAGALEITEIMGVNPSDCIYVGDTAVDMQTGKSAGMFTVGVLWGFRDEKELREYGADILVSYPMEIVEYLDS